MRVRSTEIDGFNSTLEFLQKIIITNPGQYGLSLYSLINCGQEGCEDSISIKIKDGENGEFEEVYRINRNARDERWEKSIFYFNVKNNAILVITNYLS